MFLISNKTIELIEQLEFKLGKIIGVKKQAAKVRKYFVAVVF